MGRNPYLRLLRANRDFRRLYLAQLISFGGDWFLTVPLLGLMFELTGSALATTAVLVADSLPKFLLAPVTGASADRFDRRRIMVVADLARAAVVLGLMAVDDLGSPLLAIGIVLAVSSASAFFFPASNSALPNLVAPADLSAANVLLGSSWGTMAAAGAALGGLFAAAVGRDAAFAIDAVTFVVSAGFIARIRRPFAAPATGGDRPGPLQATRESIRFAREQPEVAALLTSKAGFALVAGAISLFPLISVELFAAGDRGTGFLFGARGLGALIGPFLVRHWFGQSDRRLVGTIGYSVALWGVCYVALARAPGLGFAALAVALAHLGGGSQWAMSTYGLQVVVPDRHRGRVFAFDFGLLTLTMSASFLIAGAAADLVGIRPVVAASGVLGVGFGLVWARVTRPLWERLERPSAA